MPDYDSKRKAAIPNDVQLTTRNKRLGALFLLLYTFCMATMNSFSRLVGDLPTSEKVFFRSVPMLIFALISVCKKRDCFLPNKRARKFVLIRGTTAAIGLYCNFYALDRLNLPDATMLNKMGPIFTLLFCWLMLNEKPKKLSLLLTTLAFFSSLLIIKPSADNLLLFPALIATLGGVMGGISTSAVRGAKKYGASSSIIVLVYGFLACLLVLPGMVLNFKPMTLSQFALLIACGLIGTIGHFSINHAYSFTSPKNIAVLDYCTVLFSTIYSLLLFDTVPDSLSFIGYALTIGFSAINYKLS